MNSRVVTTTTTRKARNNYCWNGSKNCRPLASAYCVDGAASSAGTADKLGQPNVGRVINCPPQIVKLTAVVGLRRAFSGTTSSAVAVGRHRR